MKKYGILKKYLISIVAVLFLLVYGRVSYMIQYYNKQNEIYRGIQEFSAIYTARYITSPDGKYELGFGMQYGEDALKDIGYICEI